MAKKLSTFSDILDLWKTTALAEALGVQYVTAQAMKRRGTISADHWPKFISLLEAKGYTLTVDDMLAMRVKARQRSRVAA